MPVVMSRCDLALLFAERAVIRQIEGAVMRPWQYSLDSSRRNQRVTKQP